ncbi:hypothetical protein LBMAG56_28040 [Verrucomicrobiota bacterium]|nr:hypothetical protein LBMAG56_28040 [Verrucomicrobiota bacterium]
MEILNVWPTAWQLSTYTDSYVAGVGAFQRTQLDYSWEVPAGSYPDGSLVRTFTTDVAQLSWIWGTNALDNA